MLSVPYNLFVLRGPNKTPPRWAGPPAPPRVSGRGSLFVAQNEDGEIRIAIKCARLKGLKSLMPYNKNKNVFTKWDEVQRQSQNVVMAT